jgi:DNA-binding NtrC family response regulator
VRGGLGPSLTPPVESPALATIRDGRGKLLPLPEIRRHAADSIERIAVETALKEAQGNLTHAAELVGISRQSFTALAQKHRLHPRVD